MLGKVSFYNCETDKYFSSYVTEFESVSSFHILKFSLHNLNKFGQRLVELYKQFLFLLN